MRVFVSVFVGVFVWVGFCITQFNLGRMLQLWIDVLDLIKHWSASQVCYKEHTISDLREQARVCGSEIGGDDCV